MPDSKMNTHARFANSTRAVEQKLSEIQERFEAISQNEQNITSAAQEMGRTLNEILSQIDTQVKTVNASVSTLTDLLQNIPAAIETTGQNSTLPTPSVLSPVQSPTISQLIQPNVNITLNTPDADGIRRSQGQITALVARAVNRGFKNI